MTLIKQIKHFRKNWKSVIEAIEEIHHQGEISSEVVSESISWLLYIYLQFPAVEHIEVVYDLQGGLDIELERENRFLSIQLNQFPNSLIYYEDSSGYGSQHLTHQSLKLKMLEFLA